MKHCGAKGERERERGRKRGMEGEMRERWLKEGKDKEAAWFSIACVSV